MADEDDRSSAQRTVSANRAQEQGLGLGQRELNSQRVANPELSATDPERPEPFDESLDRTTNADRPDQADFAGQEPGDVQSGGARDFRSFDTPNDEDYDTLGELDADLPPTSNRAIRTEADRTQGAKTRQLNKDIVSRRT
jgi:hypothetical protein